MTATSRIYALVVAISLVLLSPCVSADLPKLTPATIDVPITKDGDEFKLRYFSNKDYDTSGTGPILLHLTYGGAADEIVNTRETFVFAVAQQLNATLYVAEHRYFGDSKPPPQKYDKASDVTNIAPDLALADFQALIAEVRKKDEKLIVSGAEYAGELATLLRLNDKGNAIAGAIVSSAPLRLHQGGGLKLGEFDRQLNSVYKNEGCPMDKLKAAFAVIKDLKDETPDEELKSITNALNVDDTDFVDKRKEFLLYAHKAYVGLANENLDTPHQLSDDRTFAARPVKAFCDSVTKLEAATTSADKVKPIRLLIDAYYGTSDLNDDKLHNYLLGNWPEDVPTKVLLCDYRLPYHCTEGDDNDYFHKYCISDDDDSEWQKAMKSFCKGVSSGQIGEAEMKYDTMKNLTKTFKFDDIKNIVYIDGEYDPNQIGSVATTKTANQQYKFLIPGAAKQAHLYSPMSCDPDNLKELRYRLINILKCWVTGSTTGACDPSRVDQKLPDYAAPSNTDKCTDDLMNYPWGRGPGSSTGSPGSQTDPTVGTTTPSGAPSAWQALIQAPLLALGMLLVNGLAAH